MLNKARRRRGDATVFHTPMSAHTRILLPLLTQVGESTAIFSALIVACEATGCVARTTQARCGAFSCPAASLGRSDRRFSTAATVIAVKKQEPCSEGNGTVFRPVPNHFNLREVSAEGSLNGFDPIHIDQANGHPQPQQEPSSFREKPYGPSIARRRATFFQVARR